jgi:molybdopterin-containing oxidoreductase family membrane subunit
LTLENRLHRNMAILACVGTFLSFFHQGSLGGLYGVLRGRPFAFREGFGIWPTTFFLFILSAAAAGPSFIVVTTRLVEALTRKKLVRTEVLSFLGRVSGTILIVYVLLKAVDTMVWINDTTPRQGLNAFEFYTRSAFGTWILLTEIVLLGLLPAVILLLKRTRRDPRWLLAGSLLTCGGIAVNRFVMTIQTLSLATLPFDPVLSYAPSWEETGVFLGMLAYGVLVYSICFRYLSLFPQERELAASA